MTFEWIMGLDVTRGHLQANGTLIEATVDTDVPEFPTLEAGLIVMEMVADKRGVMVTASPPDFSMGDGNLFFLDQRRQ